MGVRCGVELELEDAYAATASDEHAMRVRRLPPAPAIADDLYHAAGMFMTSVPPPPPPPQRSANSKKWW